jgi:hypothetical protein
MDLFERAAEKWFGYGNWSAPYWFVGKEQGGNEDNDHVGWEKVWHDLGEKELIDCRNHHQKMGRHGNFRWHGQNARIQNTWVSLIRLLLSFKNPTTIPGDDAIRDYQKVRWGAQDGETVVAEIAGVRAKDVGHSNPWRNKYLMERIQVYRDRIREHSPDFVLFYGNVKVGNQDAYKMIVEEPFSELPGLMVVRKAGRETSFAQYAWSELTLAIHVMHPTAHGANRKDLWVELGVRMRKMIEEKHASQTSKRFLIKSSKS